MSLAGPGTYIFRNQGTALYVGATIRGLHRCLDPKHPMREQIGTADLEFIPAADQDEALRKAEELIKSHRPIFNVIPE